MRQATILIADPDEVTRRFVATLLGTAGYEVVEVADGERAAQLIRGDGVDLVVSELVLPVLEGESLLRTVRADPRSATTPVVILSVKEREEDIVRAFELGADDYLVKPFRPRELLARIAKRLAHLEVTS